MQKNGKIEILRFVFSLTVILFHVNRLLFDGNKIINDTISFSKNGNMGVEFFFVVSGFLMAMSICRQIERDKSSPRKHIADETLGFLWRKIKAILPYEIIFCLMMIVLRIIKNPENWFEDTLGKLPSMFLLSRTGITAVSGTFLRVDWYISSMIIVMAVIYPIAKKYYRLYTHLVGPFLSIMIIGYLSYTKGYLSGASSWGILTYHSNLRAFAEISIGMTGYEISKILRQKQFSVFRKSLLSVAEIMCYLYCFFYAFSNMSAKYEVQFLIFICVGIVLSFSQTGILAEGRIFQNKLCEFLGKLSNILLKAFRLEKK